MAGDCTEKAKGSESHNHAVTSNSDITYETFRGCRLSGVFHEEGELSRWLIFDCRWALVLQRNGSCWVENPEAVEAALAKAKEVLMNILHLAGER